VKIEIKKQGYPQSRESGVKAISKNIAMHGICIVSPVQYKLGATLHLDIQLDSWSHFSKGNTTTTNGEQAKADILSVIAEVVWSRPDTNGTYEIGVKFTDVYEENIVALDKYFSALLAEEMLDSSPIE